MQTEIGNFEATKKTLKHLKLFSLNSWNLSDVLKALEIEGYGTDFPLNDLLNNSEVKHKDKLASEFCKRISSDHDGLQLFEKKAVFLYRRISLICWQKQNIVMNLSEIPINFEWGHLALKILSDISLHLELLVETSKEIALEAAQIEHDVRVDITGITLLLADKDLLSRRKLFLQLKNKTFGEIWLITKQISLAQKRYSNLDVDKGMPFVEFCLRSLNECATSHELVLLPISLMC